MSPRHLAEFEPSAPTALHSVHHRPHVIIAGGGVAGLEALMALRAMLGTTAAIELVSPDPEFHFRPIAVAEPFGLGEGRRLELAAVAAEHHAAFRAGSVVRVDAARRIAHTAAGEELGYDFLLIAAGARPLEPIPGAVRFAGRRDVPAFSEMLARAESGTVRQIAFVAPGSIAWLLPLYELALFTAAWAQERELALELAVVTEESRPLEAFGLDASAAVGRILADAGIAVLTGRTAQRFDGARVIGIGIGLLPADAVIALPRLAGPAIEGLPCDREGFIVTDAHSAVVGAPSVFAAGDGTAFPIKQGGLAAQQADAAAEAIAFELGAIDHAEPFRPVLRGMLLTGAEPRYLRAVPDAPEAGSEVSYQPLWWPPTKIAGRYLAPYLAAPGDPPLARPLFSDREAGDRPDPSQAEDEHEAVALLLELADANARRASYSFALRCLDAAEQLSGALPQQRQEDRHAWRSGRARR